MRWLTYVSMAFSDILAPNWRQTHCNHMVAFIVTNPLSISSLSARHQLDVIKQSELELYCIIKVITEHVYRFTTDVGRPVIRWHHTERLKIMSMENEITKAVGKSKYRKVSNIRRTKSQNLIIIVSSCSCLRPIDWSRELSRSLRCSWSSADRRCSNYIWVIDNFIAYWGASYIRDLTVPGDTWK